MAGISLRPPITHYTVESHIHYEWARAMPLALPFWEEINSSSSYLLWSHVQIVYWYYICLWPASNFTNRILSSHVFSNISKPKCKWIGNERHLTDNSVGCSGPWCIHHIPKIGWSCIWDVSIFVYYHFWNGVRQSDE